MNCHYFIKNTFLKLTTKTYPYTYEDLLVRELSDLFPQLETDEFGNYYYQIGNSRTVFVSHLDTACKEHSLVTHVIQDNIVKTNGSTVLGADDKAGVTLLLWLIKNNVPGLYYFFIGEEVGCIGSGQATVLPIFKNYDRMISFDRRGTESVITHQSYTRCCSDEFATALSQQLNQYGDLSYDLDDTGVYTDSAEFVDIIPECTNISVGYYNEHTVRESQDLNHLIKLALSIVDVDWESLPTSRDVNVKDYKDYKSDNWFSWWDEEKPKKRKRRRNRSNKTYVDLGGGEFEEYKPSTKKSEKYKNFNRKLIYERTISKDELVVLKNNCFDMNDPDDVREYNYLESVIW